MDNGRGDGEVIDIRDKVEKREVKPPWPDRGPGLFDGEP